MIRQDIYIDKYDWRVRVYYAVHSYWADEILSDLREIGCSGLDYRRAEKSLRLGKLDTGLTYSNSVFRESVMVIALTSSAAEFANSSDHEKGHLCRHISQAMRIDPYGEEAQYLSGELALRMFPVAKRFMCEHCRQRLLARKR